MNFPGQIVVGPEIPDWGATLTEEETENLLLAGVRRVNRVIGMIETTQKTSVKNVYLYSLEGPKMAAVSRLAARIINEESADGLLEMMARTPEHPYAIRFEARPVILPSTREGWKTLAFSGFLTQPEEPRLFRGIFYEFSLDPHGENMVIFPSATSHHYEFGELEKMSIEEAERAPVWGYSTRGYPLTGG